MKNLQEEVKTLCSLAIDEGWAYRDFVLELKRAFIVALLAQHHGNQSRAARSLGMHRNTLERTMKQLGIPSLPNGRRWVAREAPKAEASIA